MKMNPRDTEVDEPMLYELKLFIDNDADLYRQSFIPIVTNLTKKKAAGTYSAAKAPQAFMYLVESGAKKYAKESGGGPWHQLVDIPTRKALAKQYADEFEEEYRLGSWDQYIPKKYRKKNPDCGCGCKGVGRCSNSGVKQLKSYLSR